MLINHPKPLLVGFLMLFSLQVYCQNDITAGGGTVASELGILSYSIGQVSYQVILCGQSELSQGVQQAFEISNISAVEANQYFDVSIFPNPTTDYVVVQFEKIPNQAAQIELKDNSGKLLFSKNILSKSSQVPFRTLSSGVYFLTLKSESGKAQSFKIIKNR